MSNVVIGDILPYTQATAILNQTVFGTNWTANVASDVVVYQTPFGDDPDDFTQILPYPADYSVSFIGALQQVQVTLVTPAGAGDIITVTRQTPANRLNLYSNTNFVPSMLNNDFGILTLVDQQAQLVNQLIGPRYNYSAIIIDVVDTILPILEANQFWVKNNSNTAIITGTFPSSGAAPANATYLTESNQVSVLPNSFQLIAGANITLTPGINTLTISTGGESINPGLINDLAYYAASGSTLSPLATGNNGVLVTSNSGVPSISSTLPSGLTIPSPFINQIIDTNGNIVTSFTATSSAVNYFDFVNSATGFNPNLIAAGTDSDIGISIVAKGSGINFISSISNTPLIIDSGTGYQHQTIFSFANTAATRTVTFQDSSGTLAYLSDIPAGTPSALTRTNDTNVTVTLGGTPSTALLEAVSLTLGWTGTLAETRGGTAQSTYLLGDTLYASAANTLSKLAGNITAVKQYLSQTGTGAVSAAPIWATISGSDITGAALTKTDDTNVTMTLGGTPTTALLRAASITLGWTGQLSLSRGGTNASLTASNGGIFYSTASAGAILSGTATAQQLLMSGASTTPQWSTTTYPLTNAINTMMYASSANVLGVITPVNSAGLLSSAGGVPGWVAYTGTGAPVLNTNPKIITGFLDTNGNQIIGLNPVASAVNYPVLQNSATGTAIGLGAAGSDTNILLSINGKGTSGVTVQGLSNAGTYGAGYKGEIIESHVTQASPVSFSTGVVKDLTTITLTPGLWIVYANMGFGATTVSHIDTWISLSSATGPDSSLATTVNPLATGPSICLPCPIKIVNVTVNTTVYLSGVATSTGTLTAYGNLYGVRL